MRSSPLFCEIGPAVKRSRSGYYASLRQTWLYRLQAFTGAAPPEMFALKKVRIRQLCGHAPERERDDAGGHLAHAELQQKHATIAALAHEALVSPEAFAPRRALQKRVVAYPRRELPATARASGDVLAADLKPRHAAGRLAQHEVDVSRVVGPLLLEAGVEVVASVRFARGANVWLRWPLAH